MKKKCAFILIAAMSATLFTACASKDTTGANIEKTTSEIQESVTETETTESTSAAPETNSQEEITITEPSTEETATAEMSTEVVETETSEQTTVDSSQTNNPICDSWTSPEEIWDETGHIEFHLVINSDLTYTCDDGDVSGTLVETAPDEYRDEVNGCMAFYNREYDCILFGSGEYCMANYQRSSTLQ